MHGDRAPNATDQDRATGAILCACDGTTPGPGCDVDLPQTLMASLMVMTPADVQAFGQCIQAMGCGAGDACFAASPLAQANQCPN